MILGCASGSPSMLFLDHTRLYELPDEIVQLPTGDKYFFRFESRRSPDNPYRLFHDFSVQIAGDSQPSWSVREFILVQSKLASTEAQCPAKNPASVQLSCANEVFDNCAWAMPPGVSVVK